MEAVKTKQKPKKKREKNDTKTATSSHFTSEVSETKNYDKDVDSCEEAVKEEHVCQTAVEAVENTKKEEPLPVVTNVIKINEFDRLLNLSKNIASEISCQQQKESFLHIERKIETSKPKLSIRPYTETQLAALYTNSELEVLEKLTSQYVENELKGFVIKQHPLYELLSTYLQVLTKITGKKIIFKMNF
jgi:hypothetical protein